MASSEERLVYIDSESGRDIDEAHGTQDAPFETLQFAYTRVPELPISQYLTVESSGEDAPDGATSRTAREWKPVTKSAFKKAENFYKTQQKKNKREQELLAIRTKEEEERKRVLEEAKRIVVEEDTSLPKAVRIKLDERDAGFIKLRSGTSTKEGETSDGQGSRVQVFGRVHRVAKQSNQLFVTLRDGYGFLQCVITGDLAKTYDALTLTIETSIEVTGAMWEVPPGQHAPGNRELHVDFFRIKKGWKAPGADEAITNRVQPGGDAQTLLNLRHLTLRGDGPLRMNQTARTKRGDGAAMVMLVRDAVEFAFHQVYREARFRKVSPPALVQTQVEGGATLFKFDYYGETAFLTQSSQLYLETCLPSMGNVYCIEKSFRAEKSLTRRHLSEYTHVEAELDFITFDDLLAHLEFVIHRVLEITMSDPLIKRFIEELNPGFKLPELPFKRMKYEEAIRWLQEEGILNEDGNPHVPGDDIAEAAERKMTDKIGRPIFLTHFPVEIKAFYMQKDKDDPRVTESVDCLMPGVGEIVGGSIRMDDYDELMAAYKREGIDPAPYYWYTDQRK